MTRMTRMTERTKQSKLKQAVHALARISFLDLNPSSDPAADLATAIQIASDALKAIDRDELRVTVEADKVGRRMTLHVASAAGNEAHVRELTPLVTDLLNSLAEAQGGRAVDWQPIDDRDSAAESK